MAALRARHPVLDHAGRAGARYVEQRGNHFAAAVTFFSLVSAVPLLMIVFGAAGYVLALHPSWFLDVEAAIVAAVPETAADAVLPLVAAAVAQRDTVAGVGLLASIWAGIWWMSNLREAVSAQWCLPPLGPASARRVLLDLTALAGLALALLVSAAGSVVAVGVVEGAVRLTGLTDGPARLVLAVAGTLVGLAANWLVLLWITARLPRVPVPWRDAAAPALLGAVGVGVLELSVTAFLGSVTATPGGAVFGSLLGVLLFVYLVSRFVLLVSAWAATATARAELAERASAPAELPERASEPPRAPVAMPAPARAGPRAVATALVVGVLLGIAARPVSRRSSAPDR